MSEGQEKKNARFIPTLTEVIDSSAAQMDLTLPAQEQQGSAKELKEPVWHGPQQENMPDQKETPETQAPMHTHTGEKAPDAVSAREDVTQPSAPSTAKAGPGVVYVFPDDVPLPEIPQVEPRVNAEPPSPKVSAPPYKASVTRPATREDEPAVWEMPEMPDVFSPLARNPAATPDSLRPSDLMLVALSERISAKAKARIEQNIEQHIQERIFPLLDHFAEQLIIHIQDDLLKIMREGIAEATRDELDRMRQHHNR